MTLVTLAFASLAAFSPDAVGIATADGGIRIDGLALPGTGSIPDGGRVETDSRPARLTLRNGATIDVGSQSRVRVHADRLFLEAGSSTVWGKMNVLNREGVLVARTAADAPVAFNAPPAPSSATELSGAIESKDGVLVIHDEASRLTFPLEASGAEAEKLTQAVGKKATVKGELRSGKVRVSSVESLEPATAAATAAAAETATAAAKASGGASGTATATAATGISKAVIAGVAIAGAAATGATVGFVQAQSQPSSTVSQ
jgi:hypothetical protein